jgi:hypothetical protein
VFYGLSIFRSLQSVLARFRIIRNHDCYRHVSFVSFTYCIGNVNLKLVRIELENSNQSSSESVQVTELESQFLDFDPFVLYEERRKKKNEFFR